MSYTDTGDQIENGTVSAENKGERIKEETALRASETTRAKTSKEKSRSKELLRLPKGRRLKKANGDVLCILGSIETHTEPLMLFAS